MIRSSFDVSTLSFSLTDDDFGGAVFARERREISRSGRAFGSRRDPHETPTAMDQARGSLEDLNLTKEEVDKFQNAFKDEAFKKMFAEYAAEIADPKNKAESDAYLRQLEMEGKIESVYGKDVQLVMPKAGFVAKTFDEADADDAPSTSQTNDRNSGTNASSNSGKTRTGRKAFVNVCHSDKCEDASSEKKPGGLQWSVPHTLGQPHEEKDKAGETCVAYDFCVSENTYAMAMRDERIKKMVTETAIEAVNRAFGTKLSLKFTTPRKTYVGPKTGPGVQAIKGKGKGKDAEQHTRTPGGRVAPLGGAGSSSVNDGDPSTPTASAFRFDDAVAGRPSRPSREAPASREPLGECEPTHALVHREDGKDMSKQFGRGSASREAERRRDTRPSALVLRVDLPKLDSVADAELDVSVFEEVQQFGLASLYQLRGRVGRAGRQAYAYMFHAEMGDMREEAHERLLALEECCGLGEGFKLAERDMAIRGVGTIFGDKQSGEVDSIGADLYLELLYNQLEKIEKPAGISNPKDFRNEIVNFVLRARANNNGKNPTWLSYEKLRVVIEKKMFSNTEDLLPVISFNAKGSKEEQQKHNDFVKRMVERGYTEKQVRLLSEWYLRVRKSQ